FYTNNEHHTNEKTAFLASSDDWESWNLQFQAQAVAGGIWNQVQGVTPFLNEPPAPNPAQYKHKTPSQSTITARGSTEPIVGDDEAGPADPMITTADLTTDGFRTFQMYWTIHQASKKDYIQQFEEVKRLKQWILKTPLLRAPKDLIKWSKSWEQAGVPEALNKKTWLYDFLDAVTSYKLNKSAYYRAVANDFREEVRQLTKARIPAGNRKAKGSFSPSFAAREGHTTYQEDASDSEVEPGSDGGEQNGQKRGSGSGGGKRKRKASSTIYSGCW
ncbi:hypothetical protein V8F06_012802, partial [Rhypophila decipiens]